MNNLLEYVLDAHGGLKRWWNVNTLTAQLAVGGPFRGLRGFPDAFREETLKIDAHREHAVFTPWIAPDQSVTFDVSPERVSLQTGDGQIVDSRINPRSSYAGYDIYSPWDALQVGYSLSIALERYPRGEWTLLEARTTLSRDGLGVTASRLGDEDGYFGIGSQPLLVERRM